jgi:hypothetical protein
MNLTHPTRQTLLSTPMVEAWATAVDDMIRCSKSAFEDALRLRSTLMLVSTSGLQAQAALSSISDQIRDGSSIYYLTGADWRW